MSNGNSSPEGNERPGRHADSSLIQTAFPQQPTIVFVAAIIMGLLFISITSVYRSYFAVNGMQSNLVLCIGAALVLAAFGGQATVRIGGIIMAGVAGVALGLFIYLQHSSRDLFLQGTIDGFDYVTYKSLEISQKNSVLGRIVQNHGNPKRSHYDFAIFKREIDSPILKVVLTASDPAGTERVLHVRTGDLEWAFGESQRLEWELRKEDDGEDSILTIFDHSSDNTIAREVTRGISPIARISIDPILIRAAFAQEMAGIELPLMLERLKADDASTRRGARDALSQVPIDSIPVLMKTLGQEASNYRVKLGICVALAEMLRANKSQADAISSKLTEVDLNLILDAAGDPDRTVRVYAAEFLFDLGDTRTPKLAISRAAGTSDDNARYNWLLVSQTSWHKLSPAEKAALSTPLNEAKRRSGPKTLQLFDKLRM